MRMSLNSSFTFWFTQAYIVKSVFIMDFPSHEPLPPPVITVLLYINIVIYTSVLLLLCCSYLYKVITCSQADMGFSYVELSDIGRLRKSKHCGPYTLFVKLLDLWRDKYQPREVHVVNTCRYM